MRSTVGLPCRGSGTMSPPDRVRSAQRLMLALRIARTTGPCARMPLNAFARLLDFALCRTQGCRHDQEGQSAERLTPTGGQPMNGRTATITAGPAPGLADSMSAIATA